MQSMLAETKKIKRVNTRITIPWTEPVNMKTQRWMLNVLFSIVVTAAMPHFEMFALNAEASRNTEGVYVNAQLMLAGNARQKKKKQKLLGTEQTSEQEKKEVEGERTAVQVCYLRHIPISHHTIRVPGRVVRSSKSWTCSIRCFAQTSTSTTSTVASPNSSPQSSTVRRCKCRLNTAVDTDEC